MPQSFFLAHDLAKCQVRENKAVAEAHFAQKPEAVTTRLTVSAVVDGKFGLDVDFAELLQCSREELDPEDRSGIEKDFETLSEQITEGTRAVLDQLREKVSTLKGQAAEGRERAAKKR